MAKRKSHRSKKRSSALALYRAPARSAKPIVIKQTKIVKHKAKRRHGGGGGGGLGIGSLFSDKRMQMALAGAGIGLLEKQAFYANIPALPFIGKKGTVAVAAILFGGKNAIAQDVATAAILLSTYELATTGKITGEEVGYVAGPEYVSGY